MKKLIILIVSVLAVGVTCAAGCTEPNTDKTDAEKQKSYDIVQEDDDGCEDGDCKNKKPDFRFVQPGNRRKPPHMPHKRHEDDKPVPMPQNPEQNR